MKSRFPFPVPGGVGKGQAAQPETPVLPLTDFAVKNIVALSRATGVPEGMVGNELLRMAVLRAECSRLEIYYAGALQAIKDGQVPEPTQKQPDEPGEDPEAFRARMKAEAAGATPSPAEGRSEDEEPQS